MQVSSVQQKLNEINAQIIEMQEQQQALQVQKNQYYQACKDAGYTNEDIDEDPAVLAMIYQGDAVNAQLNTLLSQKKLLEEGVADSASTSQGSNNEELQNKIDNIKLQRLELSDKASQLAAAYAENGATDGFSADMVELKNQDDELMLKQKELEAQLKGQSFTDDYKNMLIQKSDLEYRLTELSSQKAAIQNQMSAYTAACAEAGRSGDVSQTPEMLTMRYQLEALEAEESTVRSQLNIINENIKENEALPSEGKYTAEIQNIQNQINTLYKQKQECMAQASAYAAAYQESGSSENINDDSYMSSLIAQDASLDMQISNLKAKKEELINKNSKELTADTDTDTKSLLKKIFNMLSIILQRMN